MLPAGGRVDAVPDVPAAYQLRQAGQAWWAWAWWLPQATMWQPGALYTVARRAQLEDDLASLGAVGTVEVAELLGAGGEQLVFLIGGLKRLAGGSTSLMREMRELDNRLGLNPKALAELRWTIEPEPLPPPDELKPRRRGRSDPLDALIDHPDAEEAP